MTSKKTGRPEFGSGYSAKEWPLLCPGCGGECLHHTEIKIFERVEEDAPAGLRVVVTDRHVGVDSSLAGNPSMRRNGLAIRFWCEFCPAKSTLSFAQHKGVTLVKMEWEDEPQES